MNTHNLLSVGLALLGSLALGLIWWGWQQSGLAFLQLGMAVC
ncbi:MULTISPECIES: hypothetical protein [Pseudomonas]|jgi:hypothetical protein|uniref:Uncharacterized protein n=1 Tax=Pseudomonas borbori TaxID=289003 RepID=A0A1I5U962_9PSED|nr:MULTISPECIES: hypothetical protein [Pseudomonas]MDX1366821.1 hypothetical protein [Pseudomonas sp.]MDX1722606.1 hypothetical protein [Pseudomonas sp.]SFP91823.1 hypothetical protein SAMN05216190_12444 [Pseudomonas borbori]